MPVRAGTLVDVTRSLLRLGRLPAALLVASTMTTQGATSRAEEPSPTIDDETALSAQAISGWVVTSVAGAAFISATVTGTLALHKHQQLAVLCPERTCEPALHADVDQFNAFRIAATASIIGAGVAGVVGVSLLLTDAAGEDESAATTRLRLEVAPGALLLGGTF
jgi:hypothetical protein